MHYSNVSGNPILKDKSKFRQIEKKKNRELKEIIYGYNKHNTAYKARFSQNSSHTHLKRSWWIGAFLLSFAIITLFFIEKRGSFEILIIILGFLYPFIIFLQYWIYANSKENDIFFRERFYEMDGEKIIGHTEDKADSTILWYQFIKYVELKDRYLLYLSKNQFVVIPKNSFQSESDEHWFQSNALSQINKKSNTTDVTTE